MAAKNDPSCCEHKGKVVSVNSDSVTMTHDDGSPTDTHAVGVDTEVTLNGEDVGLTDLRAGDAVCVCGDPVTSVTATRP